MMRQEYEVLAEGAGPAPEPVAESESSQHAPAGPSSPKGNLMFGGISTGDEGNLSESVMTSLDRDPHICKFWPCPQCHKPRGQSLDEQQEDRVNFSAAVAPAAVAESHAWEPQHTLGSELLPKYIEESDHLAYNGGHNQKVCS